MTNRFITWGIFIFIIILGVVTLGLFVLNIDTPVPANWGSEAGVRSGFTDWINILFLSIIIPLISTFLGALIIAQRPRHRIGWLLVLLGLITSLTGILAEFNIYTNFTLDQRVPGQQIVPWFENWMWVILFGVLFLTLAIFPQGRFQSRNWGVLFSLVWGIFLSCLLLSKAIETPMSSAYSVDNPFVDNQNDAFYNALFAVGVAVMPVTVLVIFAGVIARYNKGNAVERQQIKWLAAATFAMVVVVILGLGLVFGLGIENAGILLNISAILSLAAIGLAVLRYRLYDIDVIINRAIVYGGLTIALGLVYFVGVVTLQQIFRVLTGQTSPLAIVISTLIIAGLFNPLRERLQRTIDRRFYRRKYDAEQALRSFSVSLRQEVDVNVLGDRLMAIVEGTIKPSDLSLWVAPPRETNRTTTED
jgi:hypothetical protein